MLKNQAEIAFRRAVPADAAGFPAIEQSSGEAFRTVPGLEWIADDEAVAPDTVAARIAAGTVWAATQDGTAVGFVTAERADDELHIWQASIVHQLQGQGIGRAMFAHVIAEARGWGLAAITLTTFRELRWNAPFYESLGFAIVKRSQCGDRLRAILDAEEKKGLPIERRCAMRLVLG